MKVTSYYPVIMTRDVAGTAAFYGRHFGFRMDDRHPRQRVATGSIRFTDAQVAAARP